MKNHFLTLLSLIILLSLLCDDAIAQQLGSDDPKAFQNLAGISELTLPAFFNQWDLPAAVDNSQNIYFRPIFNQIGASCGQASTIGYLFTYEMCRARDVSSEVPANQFPSHFAYNFLDYDGYYGVNYLHSLEVVKQVGSPDLETYGGMAIDEGIVWISGYEKYYNAMCNRIHQIKMIRTGTEEGLLNLKHWLAHHHEGAATGGVANFASGTPYNLVLIPPGTPEAGKKIVTNFPGEVATHAMTIVGYNDSIRYDVNGDGQFTNHLDITNDGVVDLRDWEIGALKIANSYGEVWGNEGFYFALYRSVALNEYYGGIWGNMVHVVDVKPDYTPEMAIKVTLKHNVREQVKVVAGIASNPDAQSPDHTINFSVFNYQGGKHFMQGGISNPENQTIEFGLDISPLLSYTAPGDEAAFFLEIYENDPLNSGQGEIIAFSLMDYTSGNANEIECPQANVALVNNNLTRLKIVHSAVFEDVEITSEQLPIVDAGFALQAEGGVVPYEWKLLTPYHQQILDSPMPLVQQEQLSLSPPYNKFAEKELGFDFPFYGESFDKVYVNEAGFILFEPDIYPWRYLRDTYHLFREMKNISAFLFAPMLFYEGTKQQEGIWYEGDETHATFRWNLDLVYYDNYIGHGEFAVRLFPDGSIEFYFNDIEVEENILWFAGVSAGNGKEHTLLKNANSRNFHVNKAFRLIPDIVAEGYALSDEGYFIATPSSSSHIQNLVVEVTDMRGISDVKQFQYSPDIRFECNFVTDDGVFPHNGSAVTVDLVLRNVGGQPVEALMVNFNISDPLATVSQSELFVGLLEAGQVLTIPDAFAFEVDNYCPDGHSLIADIDFSSAGIIRHGNATVQIFSGGLMLDTYFINDNDNFRLDPGEHTTIQLTIANKGSVEAQEVTAQLSTSDSFVSVTPANALPVGDIYPNNTGLVTFTVEVDPDCPIDHHALFELILTDNQGIEFQSEFELTIGQYQVLVLEKSTNPFSTQAVIQALDSLGLNYHLMNTIDESIFKYRAVMLCQGTYGTVVNLTAEELEYLGNYLDDGGNVYRESFYGWNGTGFFPTYFSTTFETLQNSQSITSLFGIDDTDFEGFGAGFTGPVNFMPFRLIPISSYAFPVMHANIADDAWTAIANDQVNYKTIASIFEFGYVGLADETWVREDLMEAILRYFHMDHLIVSDTELIKENKSKMELTLFPNPSTDGLILEIKQAGNEPTILNMRTLEGVLLHSVQIRPSAGMLTRIDLNELGISKNLKPGVYLLEAGNTLEKNVVKLIRQ